MVDNMLALSMSGCANCWAGRWPDEKHGVGPTSSASDGPTKWPTKALAQQLIPIWVMPKQCSGIHTVRVSKCIEIRL